jgi:predicted Ser/Thr protein kinase
MTTAAAERVYQGEKDSYEVLEQLGKGGFGVTWKARRASDGLTVVVKALRVERMEDWKALELFEREMRTLEALDHPGIPNYLDHFEMESGLAFVQEFVDGKSLAELRRASNRTLEEHLKWFDEALQILEYLHGLSPPVVHRDITPGNILLNQEGRLYLIDFGNVQAAVFKESQSTVAGTMGYAPMEQFVGRATPASDLYSLAMTFLACVSGSEPTEMPIEGMHVQVDRLLRDQSPDARLVLLLEEMTKPDIEQRAGSAQDARRRLVALLGGQATDLIQVASVGAPVGEGGPIPFDTAGWARAFQQASGAPLTSFPGGEVVANFSDDGTWMHLSNRMLLHTGGEAVKDPVPFFLHGFVDRQGSSVRLPEDCVHGVVSPDGELIAAVSGDGRVHIHDRRTGARQETLSGQHYSRATFSSDGKVVFAAKGRVCIDGKMRRVPTPYATYSPDGRWILGMGRFRQTAVHLYENANGVPGKCRGRVDFPFIAVKSWAQFSADGRWVVLGDDENVAVATTEPFAIRWYTHMSKVSAGSISAANRWLIVCGTHPRVFVDSPSAHMWCLRTGRYRGFFASTRQQEGFTFVASSAEVIEDPADLFTTEEWEESELIGAIHCFLEAHVEANDKELHERAHRAGKHLPLVLSLRGEQRTFQKDGGQDKP